MLGFLRIDMQNKPQSMYVMFFCRFLIFSIKTKIFEEHIHTLIFKNNF